MKFQIKTNSLNFQLKNAVIKEYPKLENLEITPSKEEQSFKSKDYYGYDNVTINPVTNSIDENIKSENIKKDVSILGVTGNVEEINTTEISVKPTETEQVITPEAPYNGFSKVTVGAQTGIDPAEYFETTITDENRNYFGQNNFIKKIPVIKVETTSLANAFNNYYATKKSPTFIGEENVTDWSYCFANSGIEEVLQYNTGKGKKFNKIFSAYSCVKIHLLDFSSATSISDMFPYTQLNLTTLGGFKDLGKAYQTTQSANYSSYTLNLSGCNKLTHESLMNVINNLYDIASIGVQPQKLQLGSTNLAKLTDEEKAIATNKGWSIS